MNMKEFFITAFEEDKVHVKSVDIVISYPEAVLVEVKMYMKPDKVEELRMAMLEDSSCVNSSVTIRD